MDNNINNECIAKIDDTKKILLKQLHVKFDSVPEWVESKINLAEILQLNLWLEGILMTESIESLFSSKYQASTALSWSEMFTARDSYNKGRFDGKKIGEEIGERKGKADVLLRLLEIKFGLLPKKVKKKVNAANIWQLDQWIEILLTTKSLKKLLVTESPW